MKVLVTGSTGQLGYDVINELNKNKIYSIASDIKKLEEIENKASWDRYVAMDITNYNEVIKKVMIKGMLLIRLRLWLS